MIELTNLLYDLKDELDKNKDIIEIKKLNEKINENTKLTNLLKEFHNSNNTNLKLKTELLNNKDIIKYKELELDINILILEINSKFKVFNNSKKCNINN